MIQITITAESAADVKQLVHDLAGTMSGMSDADIPVTTEVTTVDRPVTPVTPPAIPVAPPAQPPTQPAPPPVVPTTVTEYTMEQLAVAATPLMDAGKGAELTNLLQQFGVQALTALPKERYGEFATALRGLGAQI